MKKAKTTIERSVCSRKMNNNQKQQRGEHNLKNKLDLMFECDFVRVPRPFIRKFDLNTAVMFTKPCVIAHILNSTIEPATLL